MKVSLGEQPHAHNPDFCAKRGQPHLGPCIDPVWQRLVVSKTILSFTEGDFFTEEEVNKLAKLIVENLNSQTLDET